MPHSRFHSLFYFDSIKKNAMKTLIQCCGKFSHVFPMLLRCCSLQFPMTSCNFEIYLRRTEFFSSLERLSDDSSWHRLNFLVFFSFSEHVRSLSDSCSDEKELNTREISLFFFFTRVRSQRLGKTFLWSLLVSCSNWINKRPVNLVIPLTYTHNDIYELNCVASQASGFDR